jgi:hypothetical protein
MKKKVGTVSVDDQMVDVNMPLVVDIAINASGTILWVNVDGICRLRCCQMKPKVIRIEDRRKRGKL